MNNEKLESFEFIKVKAFARIVHLKSKILKFTLALFLQSLVR
jgi:hypothetical protein